METKKNGVAKSSGLARDCVVAIAICTLTAQPVLAATLPTAGSVAAGQVSIGTSGSTTTVTQRSDKAIVNWGSFSVGQGASVNFIQPGSSSAILNRVTGSTTSVIAGSIHANGQVFLINPNGIAITSTGSIKVGGGFVGSTLNITDKDFLEGHLVFKGNGASAGVSNAGIISVGRDGYAALIGGTVQNKGLIAAPLGKIGLGSGEQATLDFSGDGFLQVALPTSESAEDKNALIDNQGTLSADGGTVLISVASARDAARHAINLSGVVEANSVSGHDGKIIIGGGQGDVTVSGKVTATSDVGKGGEITVTGKNIALSDATLDASGATGGGAIRVGGDYQGTGSTQRADTTRVDTNSVIRADATQSGDGGKVIVWSDDLSTFDGLITARGVGNGKGGDAEVSGKANLAYKGFTDLSGPGGFGTLLLDPYNLTISNDTASNSSGTSATGDDSVINVTTLENALSSANVTITTGSAGSVGAQAGDITVVNDVTWTSGSTLELSAYHDINVNANLSGGTGSQIVLRSDNSGTGTGAVTFNSGIKATASGGVSVYYNPDSYTSATDYSGNMGTDTTGTAYMLVNSLDNLQAMNTNLAGNYALSKDIDAAATSSWNDGEGFVPLGDNSTNSDETRFTGIFDGQNHVISGLTIDRPVTMTVGLFGYVGSGGNISNVGLEGGSIVARGEVGGLAGRNLGMINNAYVTGTVTAKARDFVGGLVGTNNGTISNAYATGAVSGVGKVGGLVGINTGYSVLRNVYATGTVKGGNSVGGLVGFSSNHGAISNAYATGAVTGARAVGGLVGVISGRDTTLSNVYATGTVTGSNSNVGGLVGQTSDASISNAYATGTVWGVSASGGTAYRVGGLVGYQVGGSIMNAYATGMVTGGYSTGGLVGETSAGGIGNAYATGAVKGGNRTGGLVGNLFGLGIGNAYATGAVTGSMDVGGLVGYSDTASINYTYATGLVKGRQNVGGLVGRYIESRYQSRGITSSFWNKQTTRQARGLGTSYIITTADVTGLTTAQMKTLSRFSDWDIDNKGGTGTVWRIYDGYTVPLLRSFMKELTVIGGSASKTYDGNAISADVGTLTFSDANYDTSLVKGTVQAYYTANSANAGTYTDSNLEMTVSGLYSPSQQGYDISVQSGSLTINKAALTVTANDAVKTYGDTVTFTGTEFISSGLKNGETIGRVGLTSTGAEATANVSASPYVIDVSNASEGTFNAANYDISYVTGALTVDKAALTVTANDASKTYDGQVFSGGNGVTYSGLVNNETSSVLGGTLTYGGSSQGAVNAGSYAIDVSGLTSGNYDIAYVPGQLTIGKAGLTVTANDASKTYDGLAFIGRNGVTYSGLVNNETSSVLDGTLIYGGTSQAAVNAGDYVIDVSGLTSGNYNIAYVPGQLTIDKAALTVAANDASKTYDGQAFTGGNGVTYSGLVNNETSSVLGGTLTYGGTSQGAVDAGSYDIDVSGLTSGNYDIAYVPGQLTIDKAALTVTANDAAKTYDGQAFTGGNGVTYSGLVNNETGSVLGGSLTYGGTSQGAVDAGSYGIDVSGLTSGNYDVSYVPGQLTIDKAALTVMANDAAKTYDGLAFTGGNGVTYSGLVNNETSSVLGGTLTYGGTSQGAVNAGSYAIDVSGLTSGNYNIAYVPGQLTIDKAALTVMANDAAKTYDGLAFTGGNGVTYSGLVNNETSSVLDGTLTYGGTSQGAINAGNYAIDVSGLTSGNYDIAYVPGQLMVTAAP